jgi:hypothetical protein
MAAGRQSPTAIRQRLVRLGQLCFDDLLLLSPQTLDSGHWTPDMASDWSLALNNAPHIQVHFRSTDRGLRPADQPRVALSERRESNGPLRLAESQLSLGDILAAQQRLANHFAYELLRAKAPPLYDALPWHDWDFSAVTKRFPLWKTRFLLAGDGTTVTMCRCRKSAGVYVLEPDEPIARYVERKAALEKVRRFRLIGAGHDPKTGTVPRVLAPRGTVPVFADRSSSLKLSGIPLPDHSVDLAIIGSVPSLETGHWKPVVQELLRVAASVLIVENNPLCPPPDDKALADSGFRPASVAVSGLGERRCWWHAPATRSPA